MEIREPFFASQGWYPATEGAARQAIQEFSNRFSGSPKGTLAGIVPHAGWIYSGKTAGLSFAALQDSAPRVVFIFGGHLHPKQRPGCMISGAFGTPLGPVEVHEELARNLSAAFHCDQETPSSFPPDNTIELQMPFVRFFWPDAKVVAVQVAPNPDAEAIGSWAAQQTARQKLKAVAIGSTDLTHYGANYGFMPQGKGDAALRWSKEKNDRPFIDRLLGLDPQGAIGHALKNHSACCPGAAAAAVSFAKERGATGGNLIEHTTSHEVEGRGTPSMWVGYASVVF